ncbi:hypothetical protein PHLCEN_2v2519 [Hermanssonia centrifuga]|uniref:Uncharacterized protein n=1 Tax=Hermanssonia centrifuga TaxID=98765 RepID=A0A2R6RLP0_9APHY|nr:hypothetical protein PHLCEN_2v2519 [Hermanssonia centrifuga]
MSDDLKLSHKIIELSGIPSTSISSIYATRSALYQGIKTSHTTIPPDLIVLPPSLPPPPTDAADFLTELTACANAAATSAACGSILAGHNSETDEFGDIAFWLGPGSYEQGNELAVLRALDLPVGSHPEIEPVELSPSTRLPTSAGLTMTTTATERLVGLLTRLSNPHGFRTKLTRPEGDLIVYILAGQRDAGWMGLLGLGMWLD